MIKKLYKILSSINANYTRNIKRTIIIFIQNPKCVTFALPETICEAKYTAFITSLMIKINNSFYNLPW